MKESGGRGLTGEGVRSEGLKQVRETGERGLKQVRETGGRGFK